MLVRQALAQSLNIPAVKTLDFVGLPAMLDTAHRLGIDSLNRPDYGLSLTLGGGDVTLLEMTGAYAVFANGGQRVPPVAILRIEDAAGDVIEEYQPPPGEQVISPQHAYLITDILSDNEARAPAFGQDNALKLSRPAAAKTGTTDDWRDAWTLGYTPDLVAGVWVGNADNSRDEERVRLAGGGAHLAQLYGESPGRHARQPVPPTGGDRGDRDQRRRRLAAQRSLPARPPPHRDLCRRARGRWGPSTTFTSSCASTPRTGALATRVLPGQRRRGALLLRAARRGGPEVGAGAQHPPAAGRALPGAHRAGRGGHLPAAAPARRWPSEVYVVGRANMPDFDHYVVEYGEGQDPIGWGLVAGPVYAPVDSGLLAVWDVRRLANRDYTLRVVVYDHLGNGIEARTWVWVQNPTPTDTPTPTWTPTPTATPRKHSDAQRHAHPGADAGRPGPAPPRSNTPLPTLAPTDTPPPSATPTPTWTPTWTPTPTETPA